MQGRTLITTGGIGSIFAAICCGTPLLAIVFGAFGLTAWLANAVYVVVPSLLLCLALFGVRLYRHRRRVAAQACCDPVAPEKGTKS